MRLFLGIDGGGTKTAFSIAGSDGVPVRTITRGGCSYSSIGVENVVSLLKRGIEELLCELQASLANCAGCCIGLPCFGENSVIDQVMTTKLIEALSPLPLKIVNDGIVGWAGSLDCQEGIHLVSGTGSMAVGCGRDGVFARCGGWSEFFGDEGSCYWIGREGMSLFSKEADGRLPKSALYSIVRQTYNLKKDFEFIEKIHYDTIPYRDKVAAFQRHVLEAANAGDEAAQNLYCRAARELAQLVRAVKDQLDWTRKVVSVSYMGGLFHAGDWILKPLSAELKACDCTIQKPLRSASEGALLLAIKEFHS